MKKLILTGLSLLFAITLSFAQNISPENNAKEKVEKLTQVLTLNEDQQTAVYNIVLAHITTEEAIKADTTLTEDVIKQQIQVAKLDALQKITQQLTDEQQIAFAKYLEENAKKEEETEENN